MNGRIPFGAAPLLIRGRQPNAEAIRVAEAVLEKLRSGELVNILVLTEQLDGQVTMSMAFSADHGEASKMRGALATTGTQLDMKLLGLST